MENAGTPAATPSGYLAFESRTWCLAASRWLAGGLAFVFVCLVLRLGWVSDDGFITARTWDNAHQGFGWVLNRGHRVQTFTSPLFMLFGLPLYALLREPYWTLMTLNLICVVGLVAVIWIEFREQPLRAASVFLGLSLSPTLLSFATSGLENALGFVLVTAFAFEVLRRDGQSSIKTWLLAALLLLTRQDYALLVVPVLAAIAGREPRRSARDTRWGALLIVAWFGFTLAYYGFVFPNTAYAKLNVQIPLGLRLAHGFAYLLDLATRDAVAIATLAAAVALAARVTLRRQARCLLAGVVLYIVYVVWIGGDFMSGRFFTTPYVLALVVIAREVELRGPIASAIFALGALMLAPMLRENERQRIAGHWSDDSNGIIDERVAYAEHTNVAHNLVTPKWRTHSYLDRHRDTVQRARGNVVVSILIGMAPFVRGVPYKHVLEDWSLSEPLLARLTYETTKNYRPGHYPRRIPAGYLETLESGVNRIEDPCAHRLYDRLRLVTQAQLLAPGRLRAIWELNLGERTCPMSK